MSLLQSRSHHCRTAWGQGQGLPLNCCGQRRARQLEPLLCTSGRISWQLVPGKDGSRSLGASTQQRGPGQAWPLQVPVTAQPHPSAGTVPESHVPALQLMHKLSVESPPKILVERYLIEIAKNYNVPYEPDSVVMVSEAQAAPPQMPFPTPEALPWCWGISEKRGADMATSCSIPKTCLLLWAPIPCPAPPLHPGPSSLCCRAPPQPRRLGLQCNIQGPNLTQALGTVVPVSPDSLCSISVACPCRPGFLLQSWQGLLWPPTRASSSLVRPRPLPAVRRT